MKEGNVQQHIQDAGGQGVIAFTIIAFSKGSFSLIMLGV